MTTITIELSDEQARQLAEEAAQLQVTTEDLAARWLTKAITAPKPDVRAIAREVIVENAELYRRLA